MWSAFLETFPQAVMVAVSPIPIAAIILVLMSRSGFSKSISFVLGWFLGILLLLGLVITFVHGIESNMGSSRIVPMIKTGFGSFLLVMSFRSWQKRPKRNEESQTPQWMASLDRIGTIKSMVFGALLGTFNLKNLPVTISAGTIFASHKLPMLQIFPGLIAFCLVGSIGVLIPVVVARAAGERAVTILQRWKAWLSANNAVIICILFLVIGLTALIKGLNGF